MILKMVKGEVEVKKKRLWDSMRYLALQSTAKAQKNMKKLKLKLRPNV